jgi:hypothetical protein
MNNHDIHEHHEFAADHHEHAAKHHREAAKHAKSGDHEKAAHHSKVAHGHSLHATEHHEHASKKHADQHSWFLVRCMIKVFAASGGELPEAAACRDRRLHTRSRGEESAINLERQQYAQRLLAPRRLLDVG